MRPEVTANPTRPAWDYGASTTQCGIIEVDSGWMDQPMGGGVRQQMTMSSVRYGLTPRLDLRWGITEHVMQTGGGTNSMEGVGDQWLSVRYRFVEQGRIMPALAFLYADKIPTANPSKGFGSGFADQQYILIASRDIGRNHFDFNAAGTVTGVAYGHASAAQGHASAAQGHEGAVHGHDGAAQFGLALTRPVTPKLSLILESYGGPQPGASNRFGAAFTGAIYALRPGLVFDGAYARTYTAGSPRQQFLFGLTCALRFGPGRLPGGPAFAHWLGR